MQVVTIPDWYAIPSLKQKGQMWKIRDQDAPSPSKDTRCRSSGFLNEDIRIFLIPESPACNSARIKASQISKIQVYPMDIKRDSQSGHGWLFGSKIPWGVT